MNLFRRIRNAYWDFRLNLQYPGIQDAVDRTNNEAAQERLKVEIAELKAKKQRHSHLASQLMALKTEALERGW